MPIENKKIFITGGTGLLGHHLIKTAPPMYSTSCTFFPIEKKDYIPYDCGKHYLDITDGGLVLDIIKKIKPDYVIHTASMANVDYVEKNKEEARKNNLGGIINIIEACRQTGAKVIYISSNAVFDGRNPPYSEDSVVNPINYYGQLKVEEERVVKESGLKYVILRPILMYGWNLKVERKDPVTWLIDLLKLGKEVNMVDDIFCNPLFVEDCCAAIWRIIALNKEGVFHVGGEGELSRYDFARITAEIFGFDKNLIKPVKNSFFPEISPRPKNTTYCINKIKKELQVFPLSPEQGLKVMKKNYEIT